MPFKVDALTELATLEQMKRSTMAIYADIEGSLGRNAKYREMQRKLSEVYGLMESAQGEVRLHIMAHKGTAPDGPAIEPRPAGETEA